MRTVNCHGIESRALGRACVPSLFPVVFALFLSLRTHEIVLYMWDGGVEQNTTTV